MSGKSFRVDLSHQFFTNKWRNIVTMLGGSVLSDMTDELDSRINVDNRANGEPSSTESQDPDYYIVDKQHSKYAEVIKAPSKLAKCIVLSKHSEPNTQIDGVFGYLGRPTKLISFIELFDTDHKFRDIFHSPEKATHENTLDFPVLAGKHVLVVDDNNINVEIASHLLKIVKAKVQTAVNGLDAINVLNRLRSEGLKIDLILMDCQMPEMDGYESTSRIRSGEAGLEFAEVPIVALTANAMSGERTKCIDVGMNEYLTKPIVAKKLFSTLSEVLRNSTVPSKPTLKTIEDNDIENQDTKRFDKESALARVMGEETLLKELLALFIEQTRLDIEGLFELLEQKDFIQISHVCHALKGAASNIGANKLNAICFKLELASGSTDISNCLELMQELNDEYVAFKSTIEHELK
ncbi:response regulator [Psychrosphaera algicola]|uniref:Response regulator n=1 Tax=Psychrosphaera algicola TaxID=3023714 RepID=A0ABT5FA49_9GAMM|nr:response regulator [Psychrosphaera sp. G1-22]MDC2888405.1 response regulator [Psychrosphaera sp. G1-22]